MVIVLLKKLIGYLIEEWMIHCMERREGCRAVVEFTARLWPLNDPSAEPNLNSLTTFINRQISSNCGFLLLPNSWSLHFSFVIPILSEASFWSRKITSSDIFNFLYPVITDSAR
jgi:hypothetical protein